MATEPVLPEFVAVGDGMFVGDGFCVAVALLVDVAGLVGVRVADGELVAVRVDVGVTLSVGVLVFVAAACVGSVVAVRVTVLAGGALVVAIGATSAPSPEPSNRWIMPHRSDTIYETMKPAFVSIFRIVNELFGAGGLKLNVEGMGISEPENSTVLLDALRMRI